MNTSSHKIGFDGAKYIRLQIEAIEEKLSQCDGRLYLEVGGKFLYDDHAARVLPGFDPKSKLEVFNEFFEMSDILFCINAQDIIKNRYIQGQSYLDYTLKSIQDIEEQTGVKPHIVINMLDPYGMPDEIADFQRDLQRDQYKVRERYKIEGYPEDTELVLSEDGFGQDDHIPLSKELVFVTGPASGSGKLSTCLGQIYQDSLIDINSYYAKYETFPIRNLPINHPVNLAYEAATADIGDYNVLDQRYLDLYDIESINYNRDVQAFDIITAMMEEGIASLGYSSPTEMVISKAGYAITDDSTVCLASLQEISDRVEQYQKLVNSGNGNTERVEKCKELEKLAREYCKEKNYLKKELQLA